MQNVRIILFIHCLIFHRTCKSYIFLQSLTQIYLSELIRWKYIQIIVPGDITPFRFCQFFEAEAKTFFFHQMVSRELKIPCALPSLHASIRISFQPTSSTYSLGVREISHPILPYYYSKAPQHCLFDRRIYLNGAVEVAYIGVTFDFILQRDLYLSLEYFKSFFFSGCHWGINLQFWIDCSLLKLASWQSGAMIMSIQAGVMAPCQWLFLVPLKGGRWHSPSPNWQYIPLIYHL